MFHTTSFTLYSVQGKICCLNIFLYWSFFIHHVVRSTSAKISNRSSGKNSNQSSGKNSSRSSGQQSPQYAANVYSGKVQQEITFNEHEKLSMYCQEHGGFKMKYPVSFRSKYGLVRIVEYPSRNELLLFSNTENNCRLARLCLAVSAPEAIASNFAMLCGLEKHIEGTSSS